MHKLHWTPKAHEDLNEIRQYIEKDDPEAAIDVVLNIINRAEQLREFPESGPLMQEKRWKNDRMRTLTIGRYLVFYRIDDDWISVIRVLHAARDYVKILR